MADRPKELEIIERLVASASLNHVQAFRLHRELLELGASGHQARDLLDESVAITITQMPALTHDIDTLAREWSEQNLLDPANAESTARQIRIRFAQLAPVLKTLTVRQDKIIAELVILVREARRG